MPIAGMIFLGWNAKHLVLLYFVDSLVSFAALLALGFIHDDDDGAPLGTWPAGSKPPPRVKPDSVVDRVFIVVFVVAFVAVLTGIPVMREVRNLDILGDRVLLAGMAFQLVAAAEVFVITHLELRAGTKKDREKIFTQREILVIGRWFVASVIGFFLPYAFLIVIAYVGASVYFELRPPWEPERTILPPD